MVSVTTAAGCAWTTVGGADWISTSGASGAGNGTVKYSAAPNGTSSSRSATLIIAEHAFTLTQSAPPPPCTYGVSPMSASIGRSGGSGSVAVTSTPGCAWTAASAVNWIAIA